MKRVKRRDLAPGMYVVRYGLGTPDDPFVSVERAILVPEDVALHVPADARNLVIDESFRPPTGVLVGRLPVDVPLEEELPQAERLYGEAVSYAHGFMDDVRRGRPIDYRTSLPLVDGFIDSVFRNRSAAAAICKLKHFDEYTYSHSINVGILAVVLGERLGLERDVLRLLGIAGVFHDVGKARMPLEVLNKPGKLDEKEFAIMRRHPREGFELMKDQEGLPPQVLRAVLSHHERSDGNGYPDGLKGGQISRFTRVISVVDVYDALTSRRVYKDAMPPGKVLSLMYRWRLSDFSAQVVENFIKALGVYPVGSFVRLSSGEYGVVVGLNQDNPLRPPVKKVLDSDGRPVEPVSVTLSEVPDPGDGLSIRECLNPDDYGVDVSRLVA